MFNSAITRRSVLNYFSGKLIPLESILPAMIFLIICFNGCDNPDEPQTMFKAEERVTGQFDFHSQVKKISITNPIGFTYLFGVVDTLKTRYVIDRSVWAKSYQAAESEMKKIRVENIVTGDSGMYNVVYPSNNENIYGCTLNLDINKRVIELTSPNKGIQTDFLNADISAETGSYNAILDHHSGSINVKTISGKITSIAAIPYEGFCICYSESGDINIKIPKGTSATVVLKTNNGSVSIKNLDLTFLTNTNTEITGTLNDATGVIYLESKTGNVILEGI